MSVYAAADAGDIRVQPVVIRRLAASPADSMVSRIVTEYIRLAGAIGTGAIHEKHFACIGVSR